MTIIQVIQKLRDDLKLWVANNLRTKVDKEDGKGLSSNDFTDNDKTKLNEVDNKLSLTGGTMTGDINMGSKAITNITTPVNNNDAATKKYVDEAIAGSSSSGIYIQATEPENPKDGDLWVDTDDEEQTVLATVAASGSFNDLTDKPTYGIADITNLQTELDKLATQAWVQQQIAAIAIYDGSVS